MSLAAIVAKAFRQWDDKDNVFLFFSWFTGGPLGTVGKIWSYVSCFYLIWNRAQVTGICRAFVKQYFRKCDGDPPPKTKISVPEKRFTFDSLSKSENNQDIKWKKQFIWTLRWFSVNIRGKFQGAESAFSRLFLRFANLAKYDSSCKLFSTGSEIHSTAAPEARKMIELQTLRNGIPCSVFLYFCIL